MTEVFEPVTFEPVTFAAGVRQASTRAPQRGFTIIELMMTILIGAILVAIAVPGMQSLSRRSQQVNAIGDISSMLSRARSEAITRYRPVTLCVSTDGTSCSANTTWEKGWLMFVDTNNNQVANTGEDILQVGAALPAGSTLTALYFPDASAYSAITVSKDGMLTSSGTFRYCISDGTAWTMQAINISIAGMVRVAVDTDADGKLENSSSTAIVACP